MGTGLRYRRSLRGAAALALAASALAGAACGGDGDSEADEGAPATTEAQAPATTAAPAETAAAPSGELDACALITPAEAAAALGEPDATPSPGPDVGGPVLSTCSWTPAAVDGAVAPGTIALGVWDGEELYRPEAVASDTRPVDGLGDRAALSPGTGIVQWVQDGLTLQLQFALPGNVSEATMETLARQAAARVG